MYLQEDTITIIRKLNRNLAIYEITISGGYYGRNEINLNRYLVTCQSCYWNSKYAFTSREMDISNSLTNCPICHKTSIECHPIPLTRNSYSQNRQ